MMNFKLLIQSIYNTHTSLEQSAVNAINKHITLRNWLIGYYIVEFEQKGKDRAQYGKNLLQKIEIRFAKQNIKGLAATELSRYRQFYLTYPSILGTVSQELEYTSNVKILGTVSQEFKTPSNALLAGNSSTISKSKNQHFSLLFNHASFSHLVELIKIDDDIKRAFYELLIIKTSPSVRELRRSINTLSFERTGLAKNKKLSLQQIEQKIKPTKVGDAVKDFYFFDFLKLPVPETLDEAQLETALLNHLEKFIIELGNGFCFEARQKRILIGDEYFFVDMVFYHRILKCHVIIELKVDEFNHAHASQLKAYVNFYNKNFKEKGDNPPIGILMVTNKNKALVEYTTTGISEKVFVSKYAVALPSKKQLENFIKNELKKL
jgi:predicted nuclease of restriction endonuclease-like (RecB) superfamily